MVWSYRIVGLIFLVYLIGMTRFEAIHQILTLKCSEAARLDSESLDRSLSTSEWVALRLHQLICRSCRHYHRQLATLKRVTDHLANPVDPPPIPLPEAVRERIKRTLRED